MNCPACQYLESKVIDSRETDDGIRRRRECMGCGHRFTTYERVLAGAVLVVKRDGRREEFNRAKLLSGLQKACAKRPLTMAQIEQAANEVEAELQRLGRAEVPSRLIGEMVMDRLRHLDWVAYVRFASVYRDFQDLGSFQQEIEALLQSKETATQPKRNVEEIAQQLSLIPVTEVPKTYPKGIRRTGRIVRQVQHR